MMKKIVFATNNLHKLEEVRAILSDTLEVLSLKDIGCEEDIPETEKTLEGNAELKARHIFEKYHIDCFADDTGLEIVALGGKPGVFSARYAGEPSNSENNIKKVLDEMKTEENRRAHFRTVICLIESEGGNRFFEGKVSGKITVENKGEGGFGYDPIFIPEGYTKSFGELTSEEKNRISHRALAVNKLVRYLE
ncbi:MAG: non-canonical purine NTP diphosphatase [Paludibacteraceae bacterium]